MQCSRGEDTRLLQEMVTGASGVPKVWGCLLVHTGLAELYKKNQGKPYLASCRQILQTYAFLLHSTLQSSFLLPPSHLTLCGPCCCLGSHSDQSRSKHWT